MAGPAWALWLLDAAGAEQGGRSTELVPAHLRDAQIVELRRSGWMLAEIAGEVGLSSKAAVSQAITRIATELEKPARTRRRDGRSEEW